MSNGIPKMQSIAEVSQASGISYHTIRQWCLEKKIVYTKAGNKYLVNWDRFIDFLNTGDADGDRTDMV